MSEIIQSEMNMKDRADMPQDPINLGIEPHVNVTNTPTPEPMNNLYGNAKMLTPEDGEGFDKVLVEAAVVKGNQSAPVTPTPAPSDEEVVIKETENGEYIRENYHPMFSVIIPAHNCRDFILRLLGSIAAQKDFDLDKLEVVICDDDSTDNFMEVVDESDLNLNIRYCKTKEHKIKCPGNTRMDGWHEALGEWVTFCDHDDEWDDHAFAMVEKAITENNEKRFVFSVFGEYTKDGMPMRKYGFTALTWMHGKFYNRQWLIDSGIDFCEDLESHEDLYFNNQVVNELAGNDQQYTVLNYETYHWLYEPTSLSRNNDTEGEKYNYMEEHIEDFMYAGTNPHLRYAKKYPEKKVLYRQKMIVNLLHMYYYYEGMLCKNGENDPRTAEVLDLIRSNVKAIQKNFNFYKNQIVNDVYRNVESVESIRAASIPGIGFFLERHSFVDFMRHVI